MGKKIKKGTQGPIKEYISRSKAIKKLQVNLKDFRRLCILKGIYPRDPPRKLKKQNKTYYHIKDINFLAHEGVLDKFRERKAHLRKVRRAISRGERLKAIRLKARTPQYSLDPLVKERQYKNTFIIPTRYPTFQDALNDLDDPLCLINLFASFPTHKELKIPNNVILNCNKLIKQFMIYVAKSHCLRKVKNLTSMFFQRYFFLSKGATITWISPYPVQASLPLDVDYKVMTTFLEFYQVLMRFVNFKLLGEELEVSPIGFIGSAVRNLSQGSDQRQSTIFFNEIVYSYETDEKFKDDQAIQQIQQQQQAILKYSSLFNGLLFFLYSETPKASLEFVILSFGGQVCWSDDGSNIEESDPRITHVVTERASQNANKKREYIQPQWVYDSCNQLRLLPIKDYGPDKILPPHLSPFEEQQGGDKQKDIEEEVQEESEIDEGVVEEAKMDLNKLQKKTDQEKKKKEREEKHLAETMLTKKNKRLYDMIKRKEQEQQAKQETLKQKKQK